MHALYRGTLNGLYGADQIPKGAKKNKQKKNIVCCQSCKNNESSGIEDTLSTFACVYLRILSRGRWRTNQVKSPDQYVSFLCMFYCRPHSYWRTVKTFKSVMKLLLWLRCWLVNNLSVNVWAEAGTSLVSRITSWRLIYPRWCSKQQSPGSVVVNLDPTYHNI